MASGLYNPLWTLLVTFTLAKFFNISWPIICNYPSQVHMRRSSHRGLLVFNKSSQQCGLLYQTIYNKEADKVIIPYPSPCYVLVFIIGAL